MRRRARTAIIGGREPRLTCAEFDGTPVSTPKVHRRGRTLHHRARSGDTCIHSTSPLAGHRPLSIEARRRYLPRARIRGRFAIWSRIATHAGISIADDPPPAQAPHILYSSPVKSYLRGLMLNVVGGSILIGPRLRWRLYAMLGLKINRATIFSDCFFGGGSIEIGRGSFVNHRCFFDTSAPIRIGERVHFGMNVTVLTSSHEIGDQMCRAGSVTSRPVTIGSGSWIGAGVVIQPGVTIGVGTVVASGSIVTKDLDDNCLYAGAPATRKRTLND